MTTDQLAARAHLVRTARAMHAAGLCPGTSGNVSVRTEHGFLITPSGVPYPALSPDQMVAMDLDGNAEGALSHASRARVPLLARFIGVHTMGHSGWVQRDTSGGARAARVSR